MQETPESVSAKDVIKAIGTSEFWELFYIFTGAKDEEKWNQPEPYNYGADTSKNSTTDENE